MEYKKLTESLATVLELMTRVSKCMTGIMFVRRGCKSHYQGLSVLSIAKADNIHILTGFIFTKNLLAVIVYVGLKEGFAFLWIIIFVHLFCYCK